MLIVTEAVGDFGIGAELAARAVAVGFWSLYAPVRRAHPANHARSLRSAARAVVVDSRVSGLTTNGRRSA
jgi:pyruvate/2-oxoglutarate/acetoin dehydrogenase E1 component